ncbi:MAG: hypothetical protein NT129_00210 [Candidatus Aenigmarchaeota archaeon]|nr:hypothetical protein [Candidatus Aenigmarchaeota archaeon]
MYSIKGFDEPIYRTRIGAAVDDYFSFIKKEWNAEKDFPRLGRFSALTGIILAPLLLPYEYIFSVEKIRLMPSSS